MKTILLTASILIFAALPNQVQASTFVGNGGNAGDVELQVAINQIQATVKLIDENKSDPEQKLCTCYARFKEQPVCTHLQKLNEEQVDYCARLIRHKASTIHELLSDSKNLRFSWTPDNIDVMEKNGLRGADAVTNVKTKTITLNQKNFLAMKPSERIFLLAHELFHLVKLEEKYLVDEAEYPNFPGEDGGRQLINSMASSIVIESYDYGSFAVYGKPLNRSQSIMSHWLTLSFASTGNPSQEKSAYELTSMNGTRFGYRYQFNEWGVFADYVRFTGKKDILTSTKIEETRDALGLGVSYRLYPFSEPLSFWGQSHLVFGAKAEFLKGTLKAHDGFIGLEETASSTSAGLSCNYFIPFSRGLWGFAGVEYSANQLTYQKFNLKYSSNNTGLGIGAAYAF